MSEYQCNNSETHSLKLPVIVEVCYKNFIGSFTILYDLNQLIIYKNNNKYF